MRKLSLYILAVLMVTGLFHAGCTKDSGPYVSDDSILPEQFGLDIPDALSNNTAKKSAEEIHTLRGNDVYEHLRTFISVGDHAGEMAGDLIRAIRTYQINRPMSLSFEGDDDQRVKNLVVTRNSEYDGVIWEFRLTLTDADSEGNEDGGKALQVFWNRNPVRGIPC